MIRDKETLRTCAREVLRTMKYNVELNPGRGLAPGARLKINRPGEDDQVVAVRTSEIRQISLSPSAAGGWRTVSEVDLVLAVVPPVDNAEEIEVLAFGRENLLEVFEAVTPAKNLGGEGQTKAPVFVSLDEVLPVSLGEGSLADRAIWRRRISPPSQSILSSSELILLLRAEIARTTGIEPDRVAVKIKIRG